MKREDFEQALDRYGGDLGRWPEALRVEAERLIEDDHDAADELARAQKLDGLLTEAVAARDIESSLVGRIVSGLDRGTDGGVIVRPTRRLVAWASAATVASLMVGFIAGVALPQDVGEDTFAGMIFGSSIESDEDSEL